MCTFITNILFVVQNGGSKKVNVKRLCKIHTILALRIYYTDYFGTRETANENTAGRVQ